MKLRHLRPRDLAIALRELARRDPKQAEEYLDTHLEEWEALAAADPHDAADILEAIDEEAAADLISGLDAEQAADIIEEMQDEAAADVLEELDVAEAVATLTEMPADEAADIVVHLEPDVRAALMEALPDEHVALITRLLTYPADSAGGLMTTNLATLLRRLHETLDDLAYVYVVDNENRLSGVVSFRELVFARPGRGLDEVMVADPVAVRPGADREDVADLIQRYGYFSLPVVDHRGVLLGMVAIDDVIEAVQAEASEDIAAMVGAGVDETLYTPVRRSIKTRLPWIVFNLGLAFLVAAAVNAFEPVIERVAVLAAYMPVVALMGGNSGAQSQAVVIRAMAVEPIPSHMVRRVVLRESAIGFFNGLAIGLLSGTIAAVATGDVRIGLVIGMAALANMTIANLAGTSIPIVLDKLGQDPALASNIFLTLVTDMVGFAGFLGIATLFL